MHLAGAVRDRDITLELSGQSRRFAAVLIVKQFETERRKAGRDLLLEIRRWKSAGLSAKWRSRLEV